MLPPMTSTLGKFCLTQRDAFQHATEWPCAVSTISTSTPAATSFDALFGAGAHAHRRAHAQLAQGVLVGDRMLGVLDDVLTVARPRSSKPSLTISTLQAMLVHQGLGFVQRGAFPSS